MSPGARLVDTWKIAAMSVAGALVLTVVSVLLDCTAYCRAGQDEGTWAKRRPDDEAVLVERPSIGRIRIEPAQRLLDNSSASIGTGMWPFLLVIQFTYLTITLGVFGDTQSSSEAHVTAAVLGLLATYALLLYGALLVLYKVAERLDAPAEESRDKPLSWVRRYDRCELVHWIRWTNFVSDAVGFWALASSIFLSFYLVFVVSESSLALPSAWSTLAWPLYFAAGFTSGTAMFAQYWNAKVQRVRATRTGAGYDF
jgi:hypothetical protein